MESEMKHNRLKISGMTCVGCQSRIERQLRNTPGVKKIKVSCGAGTAEIGYDPAMISLNEIIAGIEKLGYKVPAETEKRHSNVRRVIGFLAIIFSLFVLLHQFGVLNLLVPSRLASGGMGYGMLFVIGLLTSVHCIAMCGGINLSQCIPHKDGPPGSRSKLSAFIPALLYNAGRVISYTVIGFILGFAGLLFGGDSDAGLPVMAQGIIKIIAGFFMVMMGINMLGLFPALRKFQPQMPKIFARKTMEGKAKSKSPFIVGLLNGLMPCGPLQSMQIVALASGNPLAGGLSMLLFSLGTVPLMLGFGSAVSALGRKFSQKVMTAGAVLVAVLGLAMLSQGGSLSGFLPPSLLIPVILALCTVGVVASIPFRKNFHKIIGAAAALGVGIAAVAAWNVWIVRISGGGSDISTADGKQVVSSTLSPGGYPSITVEAGTPVRWIINAPDGSINGCNNRINIQEYGIANFSFKTGRNLIEFMPDKAGRFQYSCWMGMIWGYITVVEPGGASVRNTNRPLPNGSANKDAFEDEPLPDCCGGTAAAQDSGTAANGCCGEAQGGCCAD